MNYLEKAISEAAECIIFTTDYNIYKRIKKSHLNHDLYYLSFTQNYKWINTDAKANIQIGNVNNLDKQKVSLTYYIGPFDSVEETQSAKYALDEIAKKYGATTFSDAKIIGTDLDNTAKQHATDTAKNVV